MKTATGGWLNFGVITSKFKLHSVQNNVKHFIFQ